MQIGATFPQTEIGTDPKAIQHYAQAVEQMGFDYILAYDHVLGADFSVRPDWRPSPWGGPPGYVHTDMFHEPLVLFGFMAPGTRRIGFATGVLILSQRQTALVAKQAAEVDVLTGGRLRLAIGTGWNDVECEALGMNFHDRGPRSEEQIALLRELWTKDVVTFKGRWHTVTAAGINPLPVQRPIPIWLGGFVEVVLKRCGRIGDGFYFGRAPDDGARAALQRLRGYAREAGRDPAKIGIESSIQLSAASTEASLQAARAWKALGATHITANTMKAGCKGVEGHLEALRGYREALRKEGVG